MKVVFKLTRRLLDEAKARLLRQHLFAAERVGFLLCRPGELDNGDIIVLAHGLYEVADEDYLDDPTAGATMGPAAIRKALQASYNHGAAMFHVHLHAHRGTPGFSRIDSRESSKFVPDFWNVQPDLPHGAIVFSEDSAYGRCWMPGLQSPVEISRFEVVGVPMRRL